MDAVVHTSSALTVAIVVFHPHHCLRAPVWVKRGIVQAPDAVLYISAQLCILQSLFEGREGIVVAAADRIKIIGYYSRCRLDGLFHDMLSYTYLELWFCHP
jgi:hypothetical protein